ncbi:cyclic AMP-dependent transcription factor ATF-6 beta isoform X1 [Strongylocentrotus purpuratus]|uniref:BZIP domain-containing protein n=1 Tax=Strongylocentrotus purpuratus TaxID=7668 RepID=A0A7M7HME4_STRPU|nr:cyclic AMP-dependent transcription factor ATF-6 beta isoform X1 [Strongylocentrotus purpuratus]|eukprot:XP_011666987.1 PREDICTED: cyclic AMP-dependent transcription factor ATF-6 beta isoform X1 [Strongylocentrotus purpuratus]
MALQFMSNTDDKFLEDNLLSSEDWGDPGFYNGNHVRDLSEDLNVAEEMAFNSGLDEEDALSRSSDLLSSITSGDLSGDLSVDLTKTWLGMTDEEHHADTTSFTIKNEPLSPPPSSDSSDSSSESSQASQTLQNGNQAHVHIKLESPPLTPLRDSSTDSPSPPIGGQHTFFTIANGNLPNKVTKSLASGVINGAKKGVAIAPKPTNGAIKLPLAPKLEPVATKTSIHSPTKPTVTIKQIPAAVRPTIIVKQSSPSPLATGRGSCAPPLAKQAKIIPVSAHNNIPSPTQPVQVVTQPCPPNVDVKAWKRQQRMIKNRESACLSRKKKKEYVQELECKAQILEKEIRRLRSENHSLRSKMETLVKENTTLKKMHSSLLSSPGRTATYLLGIVLIIGFNLSPLSLFNQNGGVASDFQTGSHAGRALLSFSESTNENASKLYSQSNPAILRHASIHDIMEDVHLWESIANQSASEVAIATMKEIRYLLPQGNTSCPHQMNITDTIRLTDVLQFWAKKQTVEQKKSKKVEELRKKKKKKKRGQPQYRRFRSGPALHVESDERALQLYDHFFQRTYDNLLEALNRRDDTFYVVSFSNDHLLLPATTHNNTHRPKMSLVMPTVTANESMWNTPKDHISMMQIDCEVVDTKVVHVKNHASTPPPVDDHNKTTYHRSSVPATPQHSDAATRGPLARAPPSYVATDEIGYHPRNLTAVNTP